jgi:hypothetical protein
VRVSAREILTVVVRVLLVIYVSRLIHVADFTADVAMHVASDTVARLPLRAGTTPLSVEELRLDAEDFLHY